MIAGSCCGCFNVARLPMSNPENQTLQLDFYMGDRDPSNNIFHYTEELSLLFALRISEDHQIHGIKLIIDVIDIVHPVANALFHKIVCRVVL